MKNLIAAATALAVATAANLSAAMANWFGPLDTRLIDWSEMLGQNGIDAATTPADGRH